MANTKISELPVLQKLGNTGAAPSAARNWDFAYTWNSGGTTFNGLYCNFTDTASAAASLVMNLQVGGTTVASVSKSGHTLSGTDGSTSAVSFGRSTSPNTGMYFPAGNQIGFAANGVNIVTSSSAQAAWNSAVIHRGMRVTVTASTAGSGAPAAIDPTNDGSTIMTNEGATAQNYRTLPSAAAGYFFMFACQDADGIRITAAAGDTIRDLASVSAAAGRIETTTIGSTLCLAAINATEWIVMFKTGTWTVT